VEDWFLSHDTSFGEGGEEVLLVRVVVNQVSKDLGFSLLFIIPQFSRLI
jgi:hypothetical protein